ncbi:MAG TPA: radical SAM family heme chaperone HemW [Actinomycetota bacterium]|nr:radical SAM family heme chaperone HemW [Actinomycetota bacterium]
MTSLATRATGAPPRRTGEWLEDPGFGVYVHVPFCLHRCHYCDFNAYAGDDDVHDDYVVALVRCIERCDPARRAATSVFFGGGTPTLLPPARLGGVLRALRDHVGVAPGAEVTVEANPETVDEAAFEALLEAGFNRVSIGVQSTSARVLRALGRTHGASRALDALRAARRAGVPDVNADLIFGSPWESTAEWRESLERVVDAGCDHVSAYALTVEEGTPLHTLVATGRAPDVDPDVQAERHGVACELLAAAGYERYEVSNWARPGRACAHNVLYWSAGDYLGFGAGAHAHVGGRRSWTLRLPRAFVAAVAAGRPVEDGAEEIDADARAGEALALGLRLVGGVDVAGFARRFGTEPLARRAGTLRRLAAAGLVDDSGGRLRVAPRATLVANEVFAALL